MKYFLIFCFFIYHSFGLAQGFQEPEMTIQGKVYTVDLNFNDPEYRYINIWNKANTLTNQPMSNPNMIEYPCSPYDLFWEEDPDFLKKNDFQEMKFLQNAFVKVLGMEKINQLNSESEIVVRLYIDDTGKVKEIAFLLINSDTPLTPADIPKLEEEILKMQFTVDPACKGLNYFLLGFEINKADLLNDWTWRK